jgi:membrane protein YqaA with SNARE-associated domain
MRWLYSFFLSGWGLVPLAALDSSPFLFLPLAIDAVVVLLASRHQEWFWIYPILATVGSLIGAGVTYLIGVKLGENGIEMLVSKRRFAVVKRRLHDQGAVMIALLDLVPPPFPYTAFLLASGGLKVSGRKFFPMLGAVRIFRFGCESLLARAYGDRIIAWLSGFNIEKLFWLLAVAILCGITYAVFDFVKGTARMRGKRRARAH